MLGIIIQGMKRIVTTVAKSATKVASFSVSKLSFGAKKSLVRFSKNMMSNIRSSKWWSKAARFVRKSGLVGTSGNIGDALNKAGASNWLTKGLSAFKYDTRSPKEYQKEYEYKTNLIESLKKKREKLLTEAEKIKDELNKPTLTIHNIPDVGDKINTLSASIDQMKSGLAQVKVSQNKTNILLSGVSDDITLGNEQLGETVLKSSESNIKVALTTAEEMKNHNMALHQETSGNIVSEINSHIDEIEQTRKDEEAERDKNDWKRKFFSNFLLIMEWILDFPGKIKMLLIKVGLMLTLALTTIILKNWKHITEWYNTTWNGGLRTIGSLIVETVAGLSSVLMDVLGIIYDSIYALLHPTETIENLISGKSTNTIFDKAADYLAGVQDEYRKDAFSSKEEREASKLVDIKNDKGILKNSTETNLNQIDPDKKGNINLDVVSEGGNEPGSRENDKYIGLGKPPEITDDKQKLDKMDVLNFKGGGVPQGTGAFSSQAVENARIAAIPDIDYNRTTSDKSITVNNKSSGDAEENDTKKDLKEIKSLVLSTNSNVNAVNHNVIKGTSKTMKAASGRQPIQQINRVDMKKASPTINPNGI